MRYFVLAAMLAAAGMPLAAQDAGGSEPAAVAAVNPGFASVLAHERRADDRARDNWRHPAETLSFFRVEPGMTVVDFMPSSGWYSRVLIPYLGAEGTYVGLNPRIPADATGYMAGMRDTAAKLPQQAAQWVGEGGAQVVGANLDTVPDALAGSADRFLIFREMHNIRRSDWTHQVLTTARSMLKDDGMLGIVQHRAKADALAAYTQGNNGYLREKDVIALLDIYGFELVEKSEVNANPNDPADWETGVWTLPPGYNGTPENDTARRAELDAIGESDRMTLLFRKRA